MLELAYITWVIKSLFIIIFYSLEEFAQMGCNPSIQILQSCNSSVKQNTDSKKVQATPKKNQLSVPFFLAQNGGLNACKTIRKSVAAL